MGEPPQRVVLPLLFLFFFSERSDQRGLHHAGIHAVAADALGAKLQRDRPHERIDAALRRGIDGIADGDAVDAGGRSRKHDGTAAAQLLLLQDGAGQQHRRIQVDALDARQLLFRDELRKRQFHHAGVAHHSVQRRAEGDQGVQLLRVGQVGGEIKVLAAAAGCRQRFDHALEGILADVGEDDARTHLHAGAGGGAADSPGAAGNQDGLAFESKRIILHYATLA